MARLTEEEIHEVTQRWMPLVRHVLNQVFPWAYKSSHPGYQEFYSRSFGYDDLVGEGCVGLMKAARKYDPEYGTKFNSYAYVAIRNAISSYIDRHYTHLKAPSLSMIEHRKNHQKEAQAAIGYVLTSEVKSPSEESSSSEILSAMFDDNSDMPYNSQRSIDNPHEVLARKDEIDWQREALKSILTKEQYDFLVEVHNGPGSQIAIAERLGVTRQNISLKFRNLMNKCIVALRELEDIDEQHSRED